ncbi:bifunctional oligoribonuclease/PAP phosphatase NrnA, partial [Elusimicrobiota bacterium]
MLNDTALKLISKAIKKNKTFFIAGHKKPDGDTIGSALALASLIKRLNKKVDVCSGDIIPDFLEFLPDSKKIKVVSKVGKKYDCAIILECSDLDRMGGLITKDQAKVF